MDGDGYARAERTIQMKNIMSQKDWAAFRAYIKELLRDDQVKKAIEERTDISARTLARWVSGETEEPDRKRLASLLRALPQYRETLLSTITKALPDFAAPLLEQTNNLAEDLPVEFWVRLVETSATTPKTLHFTTVVQLLFLQLQTTIDSQRLGLGFYVTQCSLPASPAHPVRSLRVIAYMKAHKSLLSRPGDALFCGAESLSGYSVSTCTSNIVHNVQEEQRLPVVQVPGEVSLAAYPIQRGGAVAGAFVVSSPQPDFFTQRLHSLLHIYAYLLCLAFETDQFYDPERIRLRPMPPVSQQEPSIAHAHERVLALLQRDPALNRSQAERKVWQQIEEALLTHAFDQQEAMKGDQRAS
jgi:transcriptional regulator with XRE-family HTH domain